MVKKISLFTLWGFVVWVSPLGAEKVIISCPQKDVPFEVEIPRTPAEQHKGLMYRTTLAENAGMLFIFPKAPAVRVRMWMKNTVLPLDMLFADKEGRVLKIFENTVPYSEDTIGPVEGATQVLEINAGLSKKYGMTQDCILKQE